MFQILPIRRNVEHRNVVATLYAPVRIGKVLEVQTFFTKTTRQVVIDAEKFIMCQSHDSIV